MTKILTISEILVPLHHISNKYEEFNNHSASVYASGDRRTGTTTERYGSR